MKNTICLVGAAPESLVNFRGELIRSMINRGGRVITMASTPTENVCAELNAMGAEFVSYPVSRNGLNPLDDLLTLTGLVKEFKKFKPDIIVAYTIKPVIWGGVAACIGSKKSRYFAMITGLGYVFSSMGFKKRVLLWFVKVMYKISLMKAEKVFFQNKDNMQVFLDLGIIDSSKACLVNGSGVDLKRFSQVNFPSGEFVFLCICRLLGEKGIREYAAAAQIVKVKYPNVKIQLLGPEDPSPDGIGLPEIRSWVDIGALDYLGTTKDVRSALAGCHVYVLPSYHEGMPRSVLEAMGVGRPILTTDVPGCKETVVSGQNGFLVKKMDSVALAKRMMWFVENSKELERMGRASRALAEEKFDVHAVNKRIMRILEL